MQEAGRSRVFDLVPMTIVGCSRSRADIAERGEVLEKAVGELVRRSLHDDALKLLRVDVDLRSCQDGETLIAQARLEVHAASAAR